MTRWPWLLIAAGSLLLLSGATGPAGPAPRPLSAAELRRVGLLVPSVQVALHRLRSILAARGLQTFVGQTGQDAATAAEMFATGRSATRRSWHLVGRAVDLYLVVGGEIDFSGRHKALYERMGPIAQAHGWRWLGTGILTNRETGATFTDAPHLEYREGLTWEQAGGIG